MRKKNIYFLLLLLVVLITGLVLSLDFRPRARLFPMIVILSCGVLVLIELLRTWRSAPHPEGEENAEAEQEKRRRFFITTGWLVGFALTIWFFGLAAGMPLFILAYLKTHGESWLWTIVLPVAMFVLVYFGFGILLETPLYEGWLFLQYQ